MRGQQRKGGPVGVGKQATVKPCGPRKPRLDRRAAQQGGVAGIAQPENFFNMLRAENLRLSGTKALPDHYDFDSLLRSVYADFQLICTEKDAAKLWRLVPDAIAVGLIQTAEAAFFETLDACVTKRLTARLSSSHGHKIT